MIHCTSCGTENVEDAKFCIQCGRSLQSGEYTVDRETCFGGGPLPKPSYNVGRFFVLIFGLLLISGGVDQLLQFYRIRFSLWPFVLIVIGIIVLYWGLSLTKRK